MATTVYSNGHFPSHALSEIPWSKGDFVATEWLGAVITLGEAFKKKFGYYPKVTSAYRSMAEQQALFKKYGYPRAHYPGQSDHGWGRAIDWGSGINVYRSPQWNWMNTEGRKLGWRPLNENNLSFEPWHWLPTVKVEEVLTYQDIMNAMAQVASSSPQFRRGIADAVWTSTVRRGGENISVLQEIADIKTLALSEEQKQAVIQAANKAALDNISVALERVGNDGEDFDIDKLLLGIEKTIEDIIGEKLMLELEVALKDRDENATE